MENKATPIEIKPIKAAEYHVKQSRFKQLYGLPTRSLILGPSGTGKSVLLANMVLDIYRDCFEKIYIFSPSIFIDNTWEPVKAYAKEKLNQLEPSEYYFSEYDPDEMQKIIDLQYKVIDYQKSNKERNLFQILIIIDDFADQPQFVHSSNSLLNTLYIRGRHLAISTITTSQSYKAISSIIRKNITEIYIFRLRNFFDLQAFIEELSAIYEKEVLYELYKMATSKPYAFLYVNLMAKSVENMFYDSLKFKLVPKR